MKRVFIIIFAFCSMFLSVTVFLNYSDNIYNSVFENKQCVIIEKGAYENNSSFVNTLIQTSKKTSTNIFYTTIENASSQKPTYNIYTTSVQKNFIKLESNYPQNSIESGTFLTTNNQDSNTQYYILGSTLYSHFYFYDFSEISKLELTHSKFYIDISSSNEFISYVTDLGYNVTIISNDNRIDQSESMIELWIMFVLLTVFMFFSAICFAYSRRKDIVIKKANGYSEISIFNSTFLNTCFLIPIICLTTYFISAFIINSVYTNSFKDYCKFGIIYELLYILISVLLFIIACIYVQFKKNANEIRGNKPSKSMYILSVIFRILVSIVIIWGLTCANDAIVYKHNLSKTQDSFSYIGDQYSVLSLNTGSVDLYNNSDEYTKKCKRFIDKITQKHDTIIVDSIEFMDMSDDYEKTLYINDDYLIINPIYDTMGNKIDLSNYSTNKITFLLPENYEGHALEQAIENDIDLNVIYYSLGQQFKTFNQYVGIETHGVLIDPMVMLIDEETLTWKAQSIIGEQFLLVKCKTEKPYSELKSIIEDCELSNIIFEAQTLNTIFDVAIVNANIKVYQYSIISIMYLIVLVLITLFETTVYYENNKRMLTIKKIHGYGYWAYKQFAFNKVMIFATILTLAIFMNYNLYFAILAILIDFFVFIYYIRKLEKNSIVLYLKGDM